MEIKGYIANVSLQIKASFVAYRLNKEKCPKLMRTPGTKDLEKAITAYETAYRRYKYMIKTGKL